MKRTLVILMTIGLGAMIGCKATPNASYRADLQVVEQAQPDRNPLLILVWLDQTPSRYSNGVPQATVVDFEPLLQVLEQNGGELAVGAIRDMSNRPLIRCHFDEPPISNAQEPDRTANVFARQQATKKYARALHDDVARVTEWLGRNAKLRSGCRTALSNAVAKTTDAPRTDMNGALLRTKLLLDEPQTSWSLPPQRYAVMITDGIGNVNGPAPDSLGETKLLIVNSAGSLGTLEGLRPLRFESIASAFRFVLDDSAVLKQTQGR
jgi:hypothetical protein